MTVTKQQQLEYIAKECHSWHGRDFILVSDTELGYRLPVSYGCHLITRDEWQQERDKMQKRKECEERAVMGNPKVAQAIIDAHNALKDLPHASVIMDAWTKGANEFMDSLASSKPAQDSSWHERGEFPPFHTAIEWDPWGDGGWVETKILADIGDGEFVMIVKGDKAIVGMPANFRPLRTEREKAIEDMSRLMHEHDSAINDITLGALYDAGYRKVKP